MGSLAVTHPGPSVGVIAYGLSRIYLWFSGWSVEGKVPDSAKAVFIAAPHTSNWDMPHMLACAFALRMRPSWAGKRALFKWPWGWFMRWLGGVPVDRRGHKNTVLAIAELFRQQEKLFLAVAPAGTRSRTEYWKSGFYHIAREAGVPMLCGFLDYSRKVGGLGPSILPSGDLSADMDRIREFYEDIQGKFPQLKSVIRLQDEETPQQRVVGS